MHSLISGHWDELLDGIVKDAVREIPAYAEAPLKLTTARVERWLEVLRDSLAQNDPAWLAGYLNSVALERREEGYSIRDLYAIVAISERWLQKLVDREIPDPVQATGQKALLTAVMDSARMTLGVAYLLSMAEEEQE